jgi:hypothetical protein
MEPGLFIWTLFIGIVFGCVIMYIAMEINLGTEQERFSKLLDMKNMRYGNPLAIDEWFIKCFWRLASMIHQNAVDKGFWQAGVDRNDGEMIALEHAELSEALENIRHGFPPDQHVPEFLGVEVEYADAIIRIMDHVFVRGWRVPQAILAKMAYNTKREYMHGKKF